MNAWVCILPSSLALQMASPGRGLRPEGGTSETLGGRNVRGLGPRKVGPARGHWHWGGDSDIGNRGDPGRRGAGGSENPCVGF